MVYGENATPENVGRVVDSLCELYPTIPREQHQEIVEVTYDNYFSEEGIFSWYESSSGDLTPEALGEILKNLHGYFYAESHDCGETDFSCFEE